MTLNVWLPPVYRTAEAPILLWGATLKKSHHNCKSTVLEFLLFSADCVGCLQYQFNNRILAAAVARRPATAYEMTHSEEHTSSKFTPLLYQAKAAT